MRQGDTIADGVGDLLVSLKIIEEGRLDASLVYRLAGIAPGWSSLLQLSCDGFDSELARVLSISLQSRNDETIGPAPPMGELADGRPYIRVPYLLFSDDFSSVGGRGGSCGGCYLAPMLSPASGKIGMHNVRVLSLTPSWCELKCCTTECY